MLFGASLTCPFLKIAYHFALRVPLALELMPGYRLAGKAGIAKRWQPEGGVKVTDILVPNFLKDVKKK